MGDLLLASMDERDVEGARFVFAAKKRSKRAVCWASRVNGDVLRAIFKEVSALGLARPIIIYGHVCTVSETPSFRFRQVGGTVSGALFLAPAETTSDSMRAELGDPEMFLSKRPRRKS